MFSSPLQRIDKNKYGGRLDRKSPSAGAGGHTVGGGTRKPRVGQDERGGRLFAQWSYAGVYLQLGGNMPDMGPWSWGENPGHASAGMRQSPPTAANLRSRHRFCCARAIRSSTAARQGSSMVGA